MGNEGDEGVGGDGGDEGDEGVGEELFSLSSQSPVPSPLSPFPHSPVPN
ncbi:hypothetical protein [Anabaena azotica]|uniref:Uncharacterized protein n=1 Tax=Anabaena azotica FACHB-119 TaxID=947527 RepID=A0ABR8CXM4_9NOST|nr:hypothetical protein [Anabaena azotica]MBD2499690.1 hypothetical protein [Anabaena azotica FACHB-119]